MMAGRFAYNAAGQRVWIEDGAVGGYVDPGSYNGGGLVMGSGTVKPGAKANEGGLSNYYDNMEAARRLWDDAANPNQMAAAQAGPVSIGRTNELATREQQMALLAQLQGQAAGGGPSVAAGMNREGMDAATRAQMGSRAGWRAGLAAGAPAMSNVALGSAAMKAGEQQGAWNALGGAAFGVRGADAMAATEEAKLYQQMQLANAGFKQQANISNQNAQLGALANRGASAQQYGGLVGANRDARTQSWGLGIEEERTDKTQKQAHQDRSDAQMSGFINTAAKMLVFASDERVKEGVAPGDDKLRQMFDALTAYDYKYTDTKREGTSPGRHVSVMAQDLEKSEIGRAAVSESDEGHKMVDYAKLLPAQIAATAMLHKGQKELLERLDALESKGKR